MIRDNVKDVKFVYNGTDDCRLYFNSYDEIMDLMRIFNKHDQDKTFLTMGEVIKFVKGDEAALDSILSHPAEEYVADHSELHIVQLLSFGNPVLNNGYVFMGKLPEFRHKSFYMKEDK